MTVDFGVGVRLHVRMRTKLENAILHNGQQLGSAVNNFVDQGKFEAMKTLSGHRVLHCGKHQFCAKNYNEYLWQASFTQEKSACFTEFSVTEHILPLHTRAWERGKLLDADILWVKIDSYLL